MNLEKRDQFDPQDQYNQISTTPRRKFLGGAIILGTVAGVSIRIFARDILNSLLRSGENLKFIPNTLNLNYDSVQSPESLSQLNWAPDTHTSTIKLGAETVMFLTAGRSTMRISLSDFNKIAEIRQVTYPGMFSFGPDYSGIMSVFQLDSKNPHHLTAFVHTEKHLNENGFPYRAQIGIMKSRNAGYSWETLNTPIITGTNLNLSQEFATGAGNGCFIEYKNDIVGFYVNWDFTSGQADAIHMAKAPKDKVTDPSAWKFLTDYGFEKFRPGIKTRPAINVPNLPEAHYAALPSISFNTHLNRYLAVYETNIGFHVATSINLIDWIQDGMILKFPKPHSQLENGDTWFSYPSLLDLSQQNDRITGKSGYLIFSQGIIGAPHKVAVAPYQFA